VSELAKALCLIALSAQSFLPVRHKHYPTVTMSVSVYVPMAGGINGGACVGKHYSACFVQTGNAACGASYPRGTVFVLPDDVGLWGLPLVVKCIDRGGAIGKHDLDIALVSENVKGDLRKARAWGRRRVSVLVIMP